LRPIGVPYSEGYWQRTEAGWYWVSAEPWAWATYHYGRWDLSADFGWYWVPQIQWAPAWVSWHSGGGYIGWAPLYPSNVRVISPRASEQPAGEKQGGSEKNKPDKADKDQANKGKD
jgi:hypothetical protein